MCQAFWYVKKRTLHLKSAERRTPVLVCSGSEARLVLCFLVSEGFVSKESKEPHLSSHESSDFFVQPQ